MPIFKFTRRPNVQKFKSEGDVESLIEALAFQDDHNVRLAAASALGQIGDERATQPLIEALDDRNRVKEVVAKALGEIGDPKAVEPLIATLDDHNWEIRSTVARSLGKLNDPKAVPALVELLDDKHEIVRWYASQSLETITGESFGSDAEQWAQLAEQMQIQS